MIKVSELKRHGIEVVAGDTDSKGFAVSETNANWVNTTSTHDHHEIAEFSWRPVTGEQPVNDNVVVDLKTQTDHLGGGHIYEGYVWNDETVQYPPFLSHWRPSMKWLVEQTIQTETPEEKAALDKINMPSLTSTLSEIKEYISSGTKPTFTQEMADAGELPPVGSKVVLIEETGFYNCNFNVVNSYEEGEEVTVAGHIRHPSNLTGCLDCIVINASVNSGFVVINPQWVRPLQTEREKAIEDIIDILSKYESDVTELVKDSSTFKGVAQAIYDAGYRKS